MSVETRRPIMLSALAAHAAAIRAQIEAAQTMDALDEIGARLAALSDLTAPRAGWVAPRDQAAPATNRTNRPEST
jgi:hypothetical protein